ncbi:MAG TPA: Gfo/Idh/MocA family oxidoreductase [Anaerolineae bacterium]|nr:Gfo/Idh/MocA family oxidoreductase [Anaerolineae bacterium]HQH39284.1 Gfo/Idh/MocA family oxidoreductase [Anaerolineae bacterium]
MSKKFRVAIIGTGMIGSTAHAPAWAALPDDVELVATADIRPERAKNVAAGFGIPAHYGDWQKMLDEVKPDIVSVCTPNCYHKAPTIAALKAGAHVCCEKPIAPGYADAKEMFDVAESVGRELFITQTSRFTSLADAAKKYVEEGMLGDIYYAETGMLRRRGIPKWGVFHIKEHNAGGPVYDLGVHDLDLFMWVMGDPTPVAVSGQTVLKFGNKDEQLATSLFDSGAYAGLLYTPDPYDYRQFDVEDFASGYIRFANGAVLVLRTSWAANIQQAAGSSFMLGTKGGLNFKPSLTYVANQVGYMVETSPNLPGDRDVGFAGHFRHHAHVIRVLRGEEEKIVKRHQVLNVIKTLDALYASSESGKEVRLD